MATNEVQTNGVSAYNVIAVSFDPDTNAYAALTALKELDAQGRVNVDAAAVVVEAGEGPPYIRGVQVTTCGQWSEGMARLGAARNRRACASS